MFTAGFVFFALQALCLVAASYICFFVGSAPLRFLGGGLFLLKLVSYGCALFFFKLSSLSLVDFFLGALLSFVLFLALLGRVVHRVS